MNDVFLGLCFKNYITQVMCMLQNIFVCIKHCRINMEKKERKKELQCSYHKKLTIAISPVFEFHTELFTYLYKLISKFFRIL